MVIKYAQIFPQSVVPQSVDKFAIVRKSNLTKTLAAKNCLNCKQSNQSLNTYENQLFSLQIFYERFKETKIPGSIEW